MITGPSTKPRNEAGSRIFLPPPQRSHSPTTCREDWGISNTRWSGLCLLSRNGSNEVVGGGLSAYGGCSLENLTIRNNIAYNGGGIANETMGYETMNLYNSIIDNNFAINDGGGICDESDGIHLSGVHLSNNNANRGGGIYSICFNGIVQLDKLIIENNTANQNGGGIYLQIIKGLDFSNSRITSNTAKNGGGMYIDDQYNFFGASTVVNIEVSLNEATLNGGGIYYYAIPAYSLCTFKKLTTVSNLAGQAGGGIFCAAATTVSFTNSIFWNNGADEIADSTGNAIVTYSDIKGGYTGIANINANPLFIDSTNGDYHLSWLNFPLEDNTKSPCIESGSDSSDMGAYPFDRAYHEQFMPVINSILDVPDDQGKQVTLNWTRSILDTANGGTINKYTIWRKQDWTKESWEYMGYTPALNLEEYNFIAPTVSDSTSNGIPYFSYMVSAVEVDSNIFYNCYPDSGYSIDNIAPYPPEGLSGLFENDTVFLNWNKNPDDDFYYYAIYKSDNPDNFTDTAYYTLTDTNYTDLSIEYDTIYYYLTAFDFNGNESLRSDTIEVIISTQMKLDIKVFLEGPYNNNEMTTVLNILGYLPVEQPYDTVPWNYYTSEAVASIPTLNVVDWVLVDLLKPIGGKVNQSFELIESKAGFLLSDGTITDLDGISYLSCITGNTPVVYIRIQHRNHLPVTSAAPLIEANGIYSYDFTTNADKAIGGIHSQKQITSGVWSMYAADGNANNQIDNRDKNEVWMIQQSKFGYLEGDFNMDGHVDDVDKEVKWSENVGHGVNLQICPSTISSCKDTIE